MKIKKILSMILVALLVVGILPVGTFASEIVELVASDSLVPSHMTVTQDKVSTLAPGVTQHQVALFDKNGDRVEMLVAIADMDVETIDIYANYKDNQNQVLGMQKTTEQVAAAVAKHQGENYNPVVAINASYYNTSNGRPTGAFVMEGVDATASGQGMAYPFFAILKDGTAMIGAKGEYDTYKDQIQEAVGGYIHIVKDGAIASNLNKVDKYPRQTIGITADNDVVIMTSDGNQAPVSIGMTVQEQAEVMLALGCVEALHLDGGGSATYCAKPEGSNELVVLNSPSNGSERAVSNSLMIVSTAVPDGTFDHAVITAENEFVTPGSTVAFSALGVDAAGGVAEIPENAVYSLADSSFGEMDGSNFVSTGKTGAAEVQMLVDGVVVGSATVNVVVPDSLSFGREQITVPYGREVDVVVSAFYGVNEVAYKSGDIILALADEGAGEIDGMKIIPPSAGSGITDTTLTATFASDSSIAATAAVKYGKGSEVVFDFEEGTAGANMDNWIVRTHESKIANNEQGEVYIVNKDTGLVHNGEQALAFNCDFSQTTGSGSATAGYLAMSMSWGGDPISIKGAQTLGFWLYIPEDAMTTEITVNTIYYDASGKPQRRTRDGVDDYGEPIYTPYWADHMEESGWQYVSVDLSSFTDDLLIKDDTSLSQAFKRNFFIKIYCVFGSDTINFADFHGDFTYYIDDVTVDYSDAVDDRELPVFGNAVAYGTASEKTLAHGRVTTLSENSLVFGVPVADNTTKSNYSGIDAATAKVYVDGNEVDATYSNGTITAQEVTLADGYHRVKFEIADKNGNVETIVREINVAAGSDLATVELVARDTTLDRLLSGSVYWVDLVSDDIADIKEIEAIINLNSVNELELDQMVVADGFDVTYTATAAQAAENKAVLSIKRNDEAVNTDSNVILSIPVRVWESLIHTYAGHESETPEYMWTSGSIDARELRVYIEKGLVTFTDDSTSYFSGDICVDTEAYTHYYNMDATYHAEKGSYHVHTVEALADLAPTCTEDGYTGRTYCAVCDSVVEWGTDVTATGHSYSFVDGVLKCSCGILFNGEYTDGKFYVDGVTAEGWIGDSYYVGGAALNGVHKIDGYYYNFVEGVCENQTKYTGVFYNTELNAYSFSKVGVISTGWINFEDNWYFFHGSGKAASGHYERYFFTYGVTYDFEENGKLVTGVWHDRYVNGEKVGTMYFYGPTCYKDCWREIDGERYYFDGVYRAEGPHMIMESLHRVYKCFVFDENGVYTDEKYTGFVETNGFICYVEDNIAKTSGMFQLGDDLYYAHSNGKLATGVERISRGNGYVTDYCSYSFEDNGRLYNGVYEEDGNVYYYINGVKAGRGVYYNKQGDYYVYVRSTGTCATGMYEVKANDILEPGMRLFGDDGKMFTGVREENGNIYFYRHGLKQGRGVHYVENEDYYVYVRSTGTCAVGYYEVKESAANGLLNPQFYMFGDDGKLVDITGVLSVAGNQYYFINGAKQGRGLYYNEEGEYYVYVKSNETVATGYYYVNATNGLLDKGYYLFGEDGRTVTGVVEEDGAYRYYIKGVKQGRGLYYNEKEGYYVYAKTNGTLATGYYYINATNGLLDEGYYLFGDDGRTITGIVEDDGKLCYYNLGEKMGRGLYYNEAGDYYVYVSSNGQCATGRHYVNVTNDLLPKDYYDFGDDGKLIF